MNVVAVHGAIAAPSGANEFFQLQKALPGALHIDAALLCFALAKLAEASDLAWIDRRYVMRGSQTVAKRTLPLRTPHKSINVIGTGVVLDQPGQEIPVVRIVDAQRLRISPVQIAFL